MLAGRKNKGVTLIEVMVAMFIVITTIATVANVITSSTGSRMSQKEVMVAVNNLEAIKKLVICNYSYEEIREAFKDKEVYLDSEALNNINSIEFNIMDYVKGDKSGYPSIKFKGSEGQGGTMQVVISYYYQGGNTIENVFYKGNYEQVQ